MYPTIYFCNEKCEMFDVYFNENRLFGEIDGEVLSNAELIDCIDSMTEIGTIRLIKACGGPKRFLHAYRELFRED